MRFLTLLAALSLVVVSTGCGTTVRTSERYESVREDIRLVAPMPVEATYFLRTATVTEPAPELDAEFAVVVLEALNGALEETRFFGIPVVLTDSMLVADQELALDLTRAREAFGAAAASLRDTKEKVLTLQLNPEVGMFADMAENETDYLLFARATGYGSSGGAVARDVAVAAVTGILFGAVGSSQTKGVLLELAIVAANTTEVLFYNRNKESESGYNPLDVESVERLCMRLLEPVHGRVRHRTSRR